MYQIVERWEPSVEPELAKGERVPEGRGRSSRGEDSWPEAVELSAGRILIALFFVIAGTGRAPGIWLLLGGPLLVLLLLAFGLLTERWGQRSSRAVWVIDAATLGTLTPILIFGAFAATGDGTLRSGEHSIYVQAMLVAVLVAAATLVFAVFRVPGALLSSSLLPVALTAPAISSAHEDFRLASVTAALTFVWMVAAVGTMAVRVSGSTLARVIPITLYVLYMLIILVVDPSLATLGARPSPVGAIHPLIVLLLGATVLAPELMERSTRPKPGRAGSRSNRPRRARR